MTFFFGPRALILLPALALAIYAQWKVQSTYGKYARVSAIRRTTARQSAERILTNGMVRDVTIETSRRGRLSDHYDPRTKALRLSSPESTSIADIGVAAHEAGHAMQHAEGYAALALRSAIVPIAQFGSSLALPLFFFGFLAQMEALMTVGIIFFSAAVFFSLVTLPVEFDASRRAVAALRGLGLVTEDELDGVKDVLFAAALTYVAAAAMAALQLLLLLSVSRRR